MWDLLPQPPHFFLKSDKRVVGGIVQSPNTFEKIMSTHSGKMNCYVGINKASRAVVKACREDIIEWNHVLIDIDPGEGRTLNGVVFDCGYVEGALMRHWPESQGAAIALYTGRGSQIWLKLRPMPLTSIPERAQVESATAAFLRALAAKVPETPSVFGSHIDFSCSDLARVARCPGTINLRTNAYANLLHVAHEAMDPAVILAHLPKDALPSHATPASSKLSDLLPFLSARAAKFLTEGVGYPGRHSAAYAAARSLLELGQTPERVRALVIIGGTLCRPMLSSEDCSYATETALRKDTAR